MADFGASVFSWLLTAWLHTALLLMAVWLLLQAGFFRNPSLREALWRAALALPLLSATVAIHFPASAFGQWQLETAAPASRTVVATNTAHPPSVNTAPQWLDRPLPPPELIPDAKPVSTNWHGWAALPGWCWALIAALALLRGAINARRGFCAARAGREISGHAINNSARMLAMSAGLRSITLRVDSTFTSPVAIGRRLIVLPDWSIDKLNPRQQRAMLAHEIAHLKRHDTAWRLASVALTTVFPTPLSAHAERQLQALAELQCDAWAAQVTQDPRALAECLAQCADHGYLQFQPTFAAPMAAADSPLVDRVRRLIEEDTMLPPTALQKLLLLVTLTGAALILPTLSISAPPPLAATQNAAPPAPPEPPAPPATIQTPAPPALPIAPSAPPASPSPPSPPEPPEPPLKGFRMSFDGSWFGEKTQTTRVDVSRPGYRLKVVAKGAFTLNDSESDLTSLGKSLTIEEHDQQATREITFSAGNNGIERRFERNGDVAPLDANAKAWLAVVLPRVMRETGADVEGRVARLLARAGVDGVLAEIRLLGSDAPRANYLTTLITTTQLTSAEWNDVVGILEGVDSDFEKRRVLTAVFKKSALNADEFAAILRAIDTLSSDFERRSVLAVAIAAQPPSDLFSSQITASAGGIEGNFERREVLTALIKKMPASVASGDAVLAQTAKMDGDFERREVLLALAKRMPRDAGLIERYRQVARQLSDFERGQAERALDRFAAN